MTGLPTSQYALPESIRDFVSISVIDDGPFFIDGLFRRRYASEGPRVPNHVVAFARTGDLLQPICYLHMHRLGDMVLVGGLCTDGDALRTLTPWQQEALRAAGGIGVNMLRYSFARFADTEAHVGYCGDARAFEIDMQAGFRTTQHQYLLIHTPRPLTPEREADIIARAHALGPF